MARRSTKDLMRSSTYEPDSSDEDSPSPEHRRTTDEFNEQQEVMELQLQEAVAAAGVAAAEAEAAAETAVSSDAPGSPRRAAALAQGTVQILTLDQPSFNDTANLPTGRSDSPDDFNASGTSLTTTGLLKPSRTESRVGLLKGFSKASRAEASDAVPAAAGGGSMSFSRAEAAEASRPSQVELVIKGGGSASAIDRAADRAADKAEKAEKAKEKEKGEAHGWGTAWAAWLEVVACACRTTQPSCCMTVGIRTWLLFIRLLADGTNRTSAAAFLAPHRDGCSRPGAGGAQRQRAGHYWCPQAPLHQRAPRHRPLQAEARGQDLHAAHQAL